MWKGWKPAPLAPSFMLMAIMGILISSFWVFPMSQSFGFAFLVLFTTMFIASLLSMVHGPIGNEWAQAKVESTPKKKKRKMK